MPDGLPTWQDVRARVEKIEVRVVKLEQNDIRQDEDLAQIAMDIAVLADVAHGARTRAAAVLKRLRTKKGKAKGKRQG